MKKNSLHQKSGSEPSSPQLPGIACLLTLCSPSSHLQTGLCNRGGLRGDAVQRGARSQPRGGGAQPSPLRVIARASLEVQVWDGGLGMSTAQVTPSEGCAASLKPRPGRQGLRIAGDCELARAQLPLYDPRLSGTTWGTFLLKCCPPPRTRGPRHRVLPSLSI